MLTQARCARRSKVHVSVQEPQHMLTGQHKLILAVRSADIVILYTYIYIYIYKLVGIKLQHTLDWPRVRLGAG